MSNVIYKISIFPANSDGYQSKKGTNGEIKAFISNIWNHTEQWAMEHHTDPFELFVDYLNYIIIHERFCLERAFQKIRIKGGMCNPCCISHIAEETASFLFGLIFEGEVEISS